jgi:FMN phosphatase YigB (HAD superfamily)
VFFDLGETLVNEARLWGLWADWLRIPHHTFFATLGSIIERREHHRRVFDVLRPGFDLVRATQERAASGWPPDVMVVQDFYPDAAPCLAELRRRCYTIGVAGNQPAEAEGAVRSLGVPIDELLCSASLGIEKPSPLFFQRIIEVVGVAPDEIAYVGDRLDNDIEPALEAGMRAVFVRRGPWGVIHATWPHAERAHVRLDDLDALPNSLRGL